MAMTEELVNNDFIQVHGPFSESDTKKNGMRQDITIRCTDDIEKAQHTSTSNLHFHIKKHIFGCKKRKTKSLKPEVGKKFVDFIKQYNESFIGTSSKQISSKQWLKSCHGFYTSHGNGGRSASFSTLKWPEFQVPLQWTLRLWSYPHSLIQSRCTSSLDNQE